MRRVFMQSWIFVIKKWITRTRCNLEKFNVKHIFQFLGKSVLSKIKQLWDLKNKLKKEFFEIERCPLCDADQNIGQEEALLTLAKFTICSGTSAKHRVLINSTNRGNES